MKKLLLFAFILFSIPSFSLEIEIERHDWTNNEIYTLFYKSCFQRKKRHLNLNFDTGTELIFLINDILKNKSTTELYSNLYNLKIGKQSELLMTELVT
jgi:hypothetical protein